MIGLIDYGAGNFTSVYNALRYLGLEVERIVQPDDMNRAARLILPGVGAYASAMRKLERLNLIEELKRQLMELRKPFLGICVGMQVLATLGREFEDYPGLGYIEATVDRIQVERHGLPLPHMGWSELQVAHPSPLFAGMSERPIFYFVHSYHLIPRARDIVLATCNYGDDLVAVVEKDNVYGVQFHPEKSQHDGLRLLKNFAGLRA